MRYNEIMDKLAYHYNKKKIPAETAGKYLYYYPCADESANAWLDGRGFITIEVTDKEWEALIELDRIDYNNEHKYVRHTTIFPQPRRKNSISKRAVRLFRIKSGKCLNC